jgi:ADP-ribose pyrophosphatase YjhB (NUDIX family)
VLLVRRAVAPHIGQLALPGGYVNYGETWQAAGAREVAEETGVSIDPATIRVMDVLSAPDSTILIFGVAQPLSAAQLPPFQPNDEASDRLVVDRPMPLAFSLHTAALEEYFRRIGGRAGAIPAPVS